MRYLLPSRSRMVLSITIQPITQWVLHTLSRITFLCPCVVFISITIINAFVAYGGWVPRNMGGREGGAGTAEPKPKQPEHPRARPTCDPATSPTRQKKKKPCPNLSPSTHHTELEEQWRTYIKDYIKNKI